MGPGKVGRQNQCKVISVVLVAAFASRHDEIRQAVALELGRRGLLGEIREAAQADRSDAIRVLEYRDRLRTAIENGSERPLVPDGLPYDDRQALRRWTVCEDCHMRSCFRKWIG